MKAFILVSFLLACSANGFYIFDLTDDKTRDIYAAQDLNNRVFFNLYTKQTGHNPQQLFLNDVNRLKNSHFNPKRPTKIITHGWQNSDRSESVVLVRDAFLQHDDYNIITIDWSVISGLEYIHASRDVLMVSKYVATMIDFLHSQGMNLNQVTIAGHSLGGHVAGLAARYAKGTVKHVVALDPALPNFAHSGPGQRVASGDAAYVEVIHTNSGGLGYSSAIGDIDFYPNGGAHQPGCVVNVVGVCSHLKAYKFYAESINSRTGFWALKCKSYDDFNRGGCRSNERALMGGVVPNYNARGSYFLKTNDKSPYAKGGL